MTTLKTLVSVVHGDPLVRAVLAAALNRTVDLEVCVDVADVASLDAHPSGATANVMVADYAAALDIARRSRPALGRDAACPIVVVSGEDREWELRWALGLRVSGYLVQGFSMECLADSVRAVRRGTRYLCPRAAARLADSMCFEPLTEREEEVLSLVIRGLPNKLISRRLEISLGTVKSHIKATYNKLNVASRTQAVMVAERRGLLERRPDAMPFFVNGPLSLRRAPPLTVGLLGANAALVATA